jgi:glycyl-tRNA synthetase beta chain
LQTVLQHGWHLSLRELVEQAAAGYSSAEAPAAVGPVLDFVQGRLRGILAEGAPVDLVDAVLGAGADDPTDSRQRLQALVDFRATPGFESLSVAIKRAGNIVKTGLIDAPIAEAALTEPAERDLLRTLGEVRERLRPLLTRHDYPAILNELARLRGPVDAFFDAVFVMAEDPTVRQNRLALLSQVYRLFLQVADFRQIGGA